MEDVIIELIIAISDTDWFEGKNTLVDNLELWPNLSPQEQVETALRAVHWLVTYR